MTKAVVDYSFPPHPSPQQIVDAGYVGVVRYLSPLPNPKVITRSEVDALHAVGLSVALVFEWYNQRAALTGYAGGKADAATAIKQAQDLGAQPGSCIYYVLEDPTRIPVSQWPVVGGYLRGVAEIHKDTGFAIGGYGSQDLVESCIYAGSIRYGWQVGGWSHAVSQHCHLYQRLGYVLNNSSDENACLQDDWGQWPRVEESDLTDAEHQMLADALIAATQAKTAAQSAATNGSWVLGVDPNTGVSTGHGITTIETIVTDLAAKVEALAAKVATIETGGLAGDVPFTGTIHASG